MPARPTGRAGARPTPGVGTDRAPDGGGRLDAHAPDARTGRRRRDTRDARWRGPVVTGRSLRSRRRRRDALTALVAGLLGALPVLAVLGAVPGRRPTLLIEWMFRGFVACALDAGALNPLVMVCERAGVPLGMHQLDGGLTYPLGGLLVRVGIEPLAAWKLAVAVPLTVGFAALFWLGRRLSGSAAVAVGLVALVALNGTLSARTWSWYWNTVAIVLLPLLFGALHVLFVRAGPVRRGARRASTLAVPALAALLSMVLIGIEWQYAAVFAVAVAVTAVVLLALERGWTAGQRTAVVASGVAGVAIVALSLRWRLSIAGIEGQFGDSFADAADEGIDLAALLVPDGSASFVGVALRVIGLDGVLADTLSDGRMLWVAPYLGIGVLAVVASLLAHRRPRMSDHRHRPRGFLALLGLVAVGSLLLSLGPEWRVADVALPDAPVASPLRWLWTSTPMRWIRYPWTWHSVTLLAMALGLSAVLPVLVRDRDNRSKLVWGLGALLAVELVSPQVLASIVQSAPSVPDAPSRLTAAHPAIARFDAEAVPELRRELAEAGGMVTLLPWGNTYILPYLGPAQGIPMRNVGIDRNLSEVEAAAPQTRPQLRSQRGFVVDQLFRRGWTDAVVLIDHNARNEQIVRHVTGDLLVYDVDQLQRNAMTVREAEQRGYCAERHSWFTVLTRCQDGT